MSISPQQQMDSLLEWAPVVAGDYLFTGTPAGVAQLLVGDELIATLETTDGKIISHPIITPVLKSGFKKYMEHVGRLGGQNKIPKIANDRKIASLLKKLKLPL